MTYRLVDSTTKTPLGKLPTQIKGFTILRFTEPTRARPSGELVVRQDSTMELMRAAPPVLGLQLL